MTNGPDGRAALTVLLYVGALVGGRVEVMIHPTGTEGRPTAVLEARVWSTNEGQQAARLLASASARFPGHGSGDLATALLSLGYELDKDAYRRSEGLQPPA